MATTIPDNRASFTLGELGEACGGRVVGASDTRVEGVTTDSRRIARGQLFVALRGERFDGHRFVEAAYAAGVAAVMVEQAEVERSEVVPAGLPHLVVDDALRALGDIAAWHRRRWAQQVGGQVVGITGSVGKTSAKELIAAGLAAAGRRVVRTQGNLNNLIGVPLTLLTLDADCDTAVVEMGTSAPGEIGRLAEIAQPEVGVVTAVNLAHAQGLASLEAIAEEKSALLRAIGPTGVAVYNADAAVLAPWIERCAAKQRLAFGHAAGADVRILKEGPVQGPSAAEWRWSCELEVEGQRRLLGMRLLGKGGAMNAAAAMAVAHGMLSTAEERDRFAAGIEGVEPVPGRMQPVSIGRGILILDDTYNASPGACVAALESAMALAKLQGGTLTAVLGDMAELGEHSEIEHWKLGRLAVQLGVVRLVACGRAMAAACDAAIAEAAQSGGPYATQVMHMADRNDAAERAAAGLEAGDVVLVKGSRSMEMERVVERIRAIADAATDEVGS